jgi:hypothetical protein
MTGISTHRSITTFNVNRLNYSIKRFGLPEWIYFLKNKTNMLPLRNSLHQLRHIQTESERMEKYIIPASRIAVSDKIDFQTKT